MNHDPRQRHQKLNRIGDFMIAVGGSMFVGWLAWSAVGELAARMGQ